MIEQVRFIGLATLPGIWETASLLRGSFAVTGTLTICAALLGVWAIAVLREG
jgi:hypothetical protein